MDQWLWQWCFQLVATEFKTFQVTDLRECFGDSAMKIVSLQIQILWVRRRQGPSLTGPKEVIAPLPAPWLGLGGDFSFVAPLPGVTAAFLAGRRSLPLGFLFACLVEALGVDDVSPPASFAFFSAFWRAAAALILCLADSISTIQREVVRIRDGVDWRSQWEIYSRRRENSSNLRASVDGSRPPQYKWIVSRVIKSLHLRSSKGISKTQRMNSSCSSVMWGWV